MALFRVRVEVDSYLQLQKPERDALQSIAASLAAIVAKLNEPDPDVPPALSAAIKETAATAAAVQQAQEQQGT